MILDPEYQSLPVHPLSPPYGGAGIRPPKTGGHSYGAVELIIKRATVHTVPLPAMRRGGGWCQRQHA